jgi:hypothetical protein
MNLEQIVKETVAKIVAEKELTAAEEKKREEIVKAMKKDFKGPEGAMYAIATNNAKKLAEEGDHEVSMAQRSLDSIIRSAMELKAKIGDQEINIPAWIQDHITNSENFIDQASQGYHEYENGGEHNEMNEGINSQKSAVESASGDKISNIGYDDMDLPIFFSAADNTISYHLGYGGEFEGKIYKYDGKTGKSIEIGDLKHYGDGQNHPADDDMHESQELNEDNLQVKSIAKKIYSVLKQNGVNAKLVASVPQGPGKSIGSTLTGGSNEALVYYFDDVKTKLTTIEIHLRGEEESVLNFEKDVLSSFPGLEQYDRQAFPAQGVFSLVFRVREKTTAKGGIQELDEDKMDKEELKQAQIEKAYDQLEKMKKNTKLFSKDDIKKAEARIEKLEDELDALADKSVNEAFDEWTVRRWQHYAGIK